MASLIHADIFFFVSTAAVILISLLFTVAIMYLVRILNDLHEISAVIRKETNLFAEDLDQMRDQIKKEGLGISLFSFVAGFFRARGKRSNEHKNKIK